MSAAAKVTPAGNEDGQWITVDGSHLVVERVVPAKRGDPYDGIALCRLALG